MEEYLSLEGLIMMLLMRFIKNRSVNKNEKNEAIGLDVLPSIPLSPSPFPLTFPDLSSPLPPSISSSLFFLLSPLLTLYLFPLLACLTSPFSSPLACLFVPLFAFPLSALPVLRVQELTLASLTRPLLGALRAAIGIKYSFISFITFILIRLSLNKSLIEPYY